MVFGLDMVYSNSSDEIVPLWDYHTFNHQCANVINIGDTKMSNVLLSMICSYFSIITFFFFCSFFICLVQDVIQIWHVGAIVGVDIETGAEYHLNGLATQEVVNELLFNIGDIIMSNVLLSMICSYFAIVTFFFFCSFFICSVQDVIQIWHVGTVVGVDTETSAEYNLNGPAAQEVVNELLFNIGNITMSNVLL